MEKTLSAWETRRQFGGVLRGVTQHHDCIVVESHGEPVAAVVPIEIYRQWKRRRQAFFDDMREISERVNLSDEEAQEFVERAIREVRGQG